MDIQERINACLTEGNSGANAGNVLHEFRASEMQAVLQYLIEKYEDRKHLLFKFWNSKSDACPLEEEAQDDQLIDFRRFVVRSDDR